MKYLKLLLITLVTPIFVLAISSFIYGEDAGKALKKGEELFNSYGCNKCHSDGKGLGKVATKEEYKQAGALEKIINLCLQGPSKAKALDPASTEMKQLKAYIEHVSSHGTHEGSKHKHEGSEYKRPEGSEHKHEGSHPKAE